MVKTIPCDLSVVARRSRVWLVLCALGLAAFSAVQVRAESIELSSTPLRLNQENDRTSQVGRLAFKGGLRLTARSPEFGGFSGAAISADGSRLLAMSDRGAWLTARLDYDDAGTLIGLGDARLAAMAPPTAGQAGVLFDPESLIMLPDGALLVATERKHRLLRYAPRDHKAVQALDLDADRLATWQARGLTPPKDFADMTRNSGIEALVRLADGRVLAIEEGGEAAPDLASRAWLIGLDGKAARLSVARSARFRPTDAGLLPNGDVLLLERRYTKLGGVAARLRLIDKDAIRPGATLDGVEIATLVPPINVDNMEALAIRTTADGRARLLMMSDDNFSALQRTLILQFELLEQ